MQIRPEVLISIVKMNLNDFYALMVLQCLHQQTHIIMFAEVEKGSSEQGLHTPEIKPGQSDSCIHLGPL